MFSKDEHTNGCNDKESITETILKKCASCYVVHFDYQNLLTCGEKSKLQYLNYSSICSQVSEPLIVISEHNNKKAYQIKPWNLIDDAQNVPD